MRARMPLAAALASLLLAAVPAAAAAQQWFDGKDGALAPDVGAVVAGWDPDGSLRVGLGFFTRGWFAGDRVDVYVDADANTATGDGGGAEYGVFYEQYGTGSATLFGVWNGSGFSIAPAALQPVVDTGTFVIALPPSLIGSPAGAVHFRVGTRYLPAPGAFDRAPDTGAYVVAPRTATAGVSGPGGDGAGPGPGGDGAGSGPGGGGGGSGVGDVAGAVRPLTARAARSAVRRVFARRKVRLTAARCREQSATRRRCAVAGRRGAWRYRGTARVDLDRTEGALAVVVRGTRRRSECARCTARRFSWRS